MGDILDASPSNLEKGLHSQESSCSSVSPWQSWDHVTSETLDLRPFDSTAHLTNIWSKFAKRFQPRLLDEERRPVVRAVHGGPRGYPELASFLNSDNNFMVYRRFGYIQARLLLEKQEGLRLLEEELDCLDKQQTSEDDCEHVLCTLDMDPELKAPRLELMAKIETAFHEYANLLQTAQAMVGMRRPTANEYSSVENYLNNEKPLVQDEDRSYYCKEDLISLQPDRPRAWFDTAVEKTLRRFNCKFVEWMFCSKERREKFNQPNEVYYSRDRSDKAFTTIMTLIILLLLMLPNYVLFRLMVGVQTPYTSFLCMGVLLASTLAFAAVISLFTRAKRHEILAASAAYCVVLFVFLGNIGIEHGNGVPSHGS